MIYTMGKINSAKRYQIKCPLGRTRDERYSRRLATRLKALEMTNAGRMAIGIESTSNGIHPREAWGILPRNSRVEITRAAIHTITKLSQRFLVETGLRLG
jgi:hypothetical protein